MNNSLVLVQLNEEQITKAKQVNGQRKQITHALLCGEYGKIFGTETRCRKYCKAWSDIFSPLFECVDESQSYKIHSYDETANLVDILFEAFDQLDSNDDQPMDNVSKQQPQQNKRKGFFAKMILMVRRYKSS